MCRVFQDVGSVHLDKATSLPIMWPDLLRRLVEAISEASSVGGARHSIIFLLLISGNALQVRRRSITVAL